jgi:hypothetical protein
MAGGGALNNDLPGPPLVGRDDDLQQITAFADQAAVSGGALLLSGLAAAQEPGTATGNADPDS